MGKARNSTATPLTDAQKKQVKRDNFARVLPPRMDKALKAIRMVGDCTNPTYLYDEIQSKAVVDGLQAAVNDVKSRFQGEPGKSGGFSFDK